MPSTLSNDTPQGWIKDRRTRLLVAAVALTTLLYARSIIREFGGVETPQARPQPVKLYEVSNVPKPPAENVFELDKLFKSAAIPPEKPVTTQIGYASWYGPGFHRRITANGEIYNMYALTCAHRSFPFGSMLKVTN